MEATWDDRAQHPPLIKIPRPLLPPGTNYVSFFLYDADAPIPFSRTSTPYLHYLICNIPCSSGAALDARGAHNMVLMPYLAPRESESGISHRIILRVHTHQLPVQAQRGFQEQDRASFRIQRFSDDHDMAQVARMHIMLTL